MGGLRSADVHDPVRPSGAVGEARFSAVVGHRRQRHKSEGGSQLGSSEAAVDVRIDDSLRVEVEALLGEDLRERALREIALRQGQPAFRAALMAAYGGTCCITGYRTEPVLEAAHIAPYKGLHTNAV